MDGRVPAHRPCKSGVREFAARRGATKRCAQGGMHAQSAREIKGQGWADAADGPQAAGGSSAPAQAGGQAVGGPRGSAASAQCSRGCPAASSAGGALASAWKRNSRGAALIASCEAWTRHHRHSAAWCSLPSPPSTALSASTAAALSGSLACCAWCNGQANSRHSIARASSQRWTNGLERSMEGGWSEGTRYCACAQHFRQASGAFLCAACQ